MSKLGPRATWMVPNTSDRPRDVLDMTQEAEAVLSGFVGFTGKDQAGETKSLNILLFEGTAAPTLTNYANTPVGTIILTPKIASIFGYQHQAKSTPAVIGDWAQIAKTTVT